MGVSLLPQYLLAEREGFEPSFPCGKHALQACALGLIYSHSNAAVSQSFIPINASAGIVYGLG